MSFTKVAGENKEHTVRLFALSTCGWCRRTKKFLKEHDIAYEYVDFDLLSGEEYRRVREELQKYNPRRSFPTLVIDGGKTVIPGYDADRMKEVLL